MVSGRSRFGVFLLMLAAAALCLGLLITTPSDAQTRAESQNARAVAGGDDCIAFEDEDENGAAEEDADEDTQDADTQPDPADTEGDAADQSSLQDEDEGDATGDQALQSDDESDTADRQTQDEDNVANQRVQSQNESSLQVQNDNTGVFQQSVQTEESDGIQQALQTEESGDVQQALEAGEEDGTGLSTQDEDDDNDNQALQNGDEDNGDTDGNDDSEQETQDENGEDENGDEDDECVIAETVPDEPLLPTGAPAKPGPNETAKNKPASEKQGKSGSKKQAETERKTGGETERKSEGKTEGKTGGKQADSAGKRSGGDRKLEVQDRGKKIEVEDRSGKTPSQEKSASRTRSTSSNDVRPEKARPGNSSSESPRPESARLKPSRAGADRPDPGRAESSRAGSMRASDLAPRLAAAEWTSPSREEVGLTEGPRRFAPDPGAEMTLSARALRLYNVPVANSNRLEELDRGLVRMPDTSLPWDAGDQRNVFVAGHYLGLPETQSRMVFYNLDKLKSGDEIVLKDSLGQTYKYRVSEKFAAGPEDSWVMGQVRGRDMLTLQTCIPPDFGKRLVVRADRVQ